MANSAVELCIVVPFIPSGCKKDSTQNCSSFLKFNNYHPTLNLLSVLFVDFIDVQKENHLPRIKTFKVEIKYLRVFVPKRKYIFLR